MYKGRQWHAPNAHTSAHPSESKAESVQACLQQWLNGMGASLALRDSICPLKRLVQLASDLRQSSLRQPAATTRHAPVKPAAAWHGIWRRHGVNLASHSIPSSTMPSETQDPSICSIVMYLFPPPRVYAGRSPHRPLAPTPHVQRNRHPPPPELQLARHLAIIILTNSS